MPPVSPAARKTYSGRQKSKKLFTALWLVRSSSLLHIVITSEQPFDLSSLSIAEPRRPVWPARYIRAPLYIPVPAVIDNPVAHHQLPYTVIQRLFRPPSGSLYLIVGDYVVALVGVLA